MGGRRDRQTERLIGRLTDDDDVFGHSRLNRMVKPDMVMCSWASVPSSQGRYARLVFQEPGETREDAYRLHDLFRWHPAYASVDGSNGRRKFDRKMIFSWRLGFLGRRQRTMYLLVAAAILSESSLQESQFSADANLVANDPDCAPSWTAQNTCWEEDGVTFGVQTKGQTRSFHYPLIWSALSGNQSHSNSCKNNMVGRTARAKVPDAPPVCLLLCYGRSCPAAALMEQAFQL